MDQLSAIISEMLKAYPDPDGVRPISNYPATMYGVAITFHVGSTDVWKSERYLMSADPKLDGSRLPSSHTLKSCS
jgi:hypothetical protein